MSLKLSRPISADNIRSADHAAMHLEAALEENNLEVIQTALNKVVQSVRVRAIAKNAHKTLDKISKAIAAERSPKFVDVHDLLNVLGYRFKLRPLRRSKSTKQADGTLQKKVVKKSTLAKSNGLKTRRQKPS